MPVVVFVQKQPLAILLCV